jgi:hypothetical protein
MGEGEKKGRGRGIGEGRGATEERPGRTATKLLSSERLSTTSSRPSRTSQDKLDTIISEISKWSKPPGLG